MTPGDKLGTRDSLGKERNAKQRDRASKGRKIHYAIIVNRNQAFSIHREGAQHKKFAQSRRMSFILRYVRVALATTDVKRIFF